jgi:hypothetical protein
MDRSTRAEWGGARTRRVLRELSSWGCRSAHDLVRGRFSVRWVLVLALLVWSGALLGPARAAASSVYYASNDTNHMSPFAIGADGSLSPIACPGSNYDTPRIFPTGEAVSPDGRYLYAGSFTGAVAAFAIGADGSLSPVACPSNCAGGPAILHLSHSPHFRKPLPHQSFLLRS